MTEEEIEAYEFTFEDGLMPIMQSLATARVTGAAVRIEPENVGELRLAMMKFHIAADKFREFAQYRQVYIIPGASRWMERFMCLHAACVLWAIVWGLLLRGLI